VHHDILTPALRHTHDDSRLTLNVLRRKIFFGAAQLFSTVVHLLSQILALHAEYQHIILNFAVTFGTSLKEAFR
jgi:hypothetical protein